MYFCSLLQIYRVSGALWESDSTRGALALQESPRWVRPHSQEGHVRKYLLSNFAFLLFQTWLPKNMNILVYMTCILWFILSDLCAAKILLLGWSMLQSLLFPHSSSGSESCLYRYKKGFTELCRLTLPTYIYIYTINLDRSGREKVQMNFCCAKWIGIVILLLITEKRT